MTNATSNTETILFGAFDRHNFGDMLFPHVVASLLPGRRLHFAGLAERDFQAYGGHHVSAISTLAASHRNHAINVVHVGGELLTCNAWEAAVMLSSPEQMQSVIADRSTWLRTPIDWARDHLGLRARAPYALSRELFPHAAQIIYTAIGGVDLDALEPEMRTEVIDKLRTADDVTVREGMTKSMLDAASITTRLLPDPAVMVAEIFDEIIRHHAASEAVSSICDLCPNGYMAIQFSADFGDDQTLDEIAAQLDAAAASHHLSVVFFRAGIAPWHDDLEVYERTRLRMCTPSVQILSSSNIWDICALIAGSRVYCGSSLHGRIVSAAFALPRLNVSHPARTTPRSKQTAFAATWEDADMPAEVGIAEMGEGIDSALHVDHTQLERIAGTLVSEYRDGFERVAALLA